MTGGIETVGIVLSLYPILNDAWRAHKAAKTGVEVGQLMRRFETEQIVFREFIDHLVGSSVSENEKTQLLETNPRQRGERGEEEGSCWQNSELQSELKTRLGHHKLQNILDIVASMHMLLERMQSELSPSQPLVSYLLLIILCCRYQPRIVVVVFVTNVESR